MPDLTIRCRDCGLDFTFTEGEQQWYQERGYYYPSRCPTCRRYRKLNQRMEVIKEQTAPHTDGLRVIIAGSRTITDYALVEQAIAQSGFPIREVVSGGARGVDRLGERWASEHGVPVTQFIPDWERFGKSAGFRRNEEMARHADALIAIWTGDSPGTRHMIDIAHTRGLKVFVLNLKEQDA